jgi:hypothetical protein
MNQMKNIRGTGKIIPLEPTQLLKFYNFLPLLVPAPEVEHH